MNKTNYPRIVLLALIVLVFNSNIIAQKGLPAKDIVTINHSTNYPQHLDFSQALLKQLKVPAGWEVSVVASGLGKPRMLWLGANGELYVTRRDAGDVLLLRDLDGNNTFDELNTVVDQFKGVHGITSRDGWLYLCDNRFLKRYQLNADGTVGKMEELLNDLPDGGQHGNRTMDFGPDGMLYLSVGSTCNDCNETNKENATMLQIDPRTWKRVIYARGLRNTIGFDWHPTTNELYGMDNGSDAKGDDTPPEELNKIEKDMHYGWPLVYGKQVVDETREEPMGMTKQAFAKTTQASILNFPAHMAPIAFQFYNGTASNGITNGDALVCWHGSWNKKNPDGYKVQRVKFQDGKAIGAEDFLTGFLLGRQRWGRPAGIVITPEGVVYISDDENGIIYCVKPSKK